jgi:murein DD-endopeptidase MepM/ murein hydrolase activator NlpD
MAQKIIKYLLLLILVALPTYLVASISSLDKRYFLCPIPYPWDMVIRSDARGEGFFAAKRSGKRMHNGIDLAADIGTAVLACRAGRAHTAVQPRGMGNYVVISHADGMSTLYGHLSRIDVADGVFVRQGQVIGRVGKTGNADHPQMRAHLHFEVKKDEVYRDPLEYLE